MYPRIGIGVIVQKGNKILIGKRKNSHGTGTWAFPGGHLEFGESWEECARREVKEETGIEISEIRFGSLTNDFFRQEKKHYVTIFMEARYEAGRLELKESDKCEEWKWFEWDNLPKPLFMPLKNLIKTGFRPNFLDKKLSS